jgi:hypothetical protein
VTADTEDSLLARTGFGEEPPCTAPEDRSGDCRRDRSWAQWVEGWLAEIQGGRVRDGAQHRLAVLLAPPPDPPEAVATAAAWRAAPVPDPARIVQRLGDLACDASQAPHLAQGVLWQIWFAPPYGRDLGPHRAALAARIAGDACPGANGLPEWARARLREIAAGRGD